MNENRQNVRAFLQQGEAFSSDLGLSYDQGLGCFSHI